MLVGDKALDALIEQFGFLSHQRAVESAIVSHKRIGEMMLALVLTSLIVVVACARRMEQGEAYGVVVRFVPTIFSIVEHGQTARAIGSREIGPLLRYHFVGCVGVIAAIHSAYAQVVSSFAVGKSHRKFHFQQRVGFLPIDFVIYIDAVGLSALVEADVLHYARATGTE